MEINFVNIISIFGGLFLFIIAMKVFRKIRFLIMIVLLLSSICGLYFKYKDVGIVKDVVAYCQSGEELSVDSLTKFAEEKGYTDVTPKIIDNENGQKVLSLSMGENEVYAINLETFKFSKVS